MTDTQSATHVITEQVPYTSIVDEHDNVRAELTDIESLADSIWANGNINPMTVRMPVDGKFVLVAGRRRHAAIGLLIKQKRWEGPVTVLIRTDEDNDTAVIAMLVENLHRVDLNAVEEAMGIQRLVIDHGLTIEDVALNIARSVDVVKDRLALCSLTEPVLDALRAGRINLETALALTKADDKVQAKVLKDIGTSGNSWNNSAQYVRSSIADAAKLAKVNALVAEIKAITGLKAKKSYPYGVEEVSALRSATVNQISKWWTENLGKGITEIFVNSDYNTISVFGCKARMEAKPGEHVFTPATYEDIAGETDLPAEVEAWFNECREVATEIEARKADTDRVVTIARAKFVHDVGKADVAAEAMRVCAQNTIYSAYRALSGEDGPNKEYYLAALGITKTQLQAKQDPNSPILAGTITEREFRELIFGSAKYITRAAAINLCGASGYGALEPTFKTWLETQGTVIDEPTWPELPAAITEYFNEAGDEPDSIDTFGDIENIMEGYLAFLDFKKDQAEVADDG